MIPWSFTFLNDMGNCPHKAYRKFVARDLPKEEMPEAMRYGIADPQGSSKHTQLAHGPVQT